MNTKLCRLAGLLAGLMLLCSGCGTQKPTSTTAPTTMTTTAAQLQPDASGELTIYETSAFDPEHRVEVNITPPEGYELSDQSYDHALLTQGDNYLNYTMYCFQVDGDISSYGYYLEYQQTVFDEYCQQDSLTDIYGTDPQNILVNALEYETESLVVTLGETTLSHTFVWTTLETFGDNEEFCLMVEFITPGEAPSIEALAELLLSVTYGSAPAAPTAATTTADMPWCHSFV